MLIEAYLAKLSQAHVTFPVKQALNLAKLLLETRVKGRTVFLAGNGGSATTASHATLDWMFGSELSNPGLRVVNLAESSGQVTATGNDLVFEDSFERPLRLLAVPGDLLVLFSASGASPNILKAAEAGRRIGLYVVGITGFEGSALAAVADLNVHCNSEHGDYGIAEDLHLTLVHSVKECLRNPGAIDDGD